MIYICCVGFASLDVVCDELNDCAWNVGVVGLCVCLLCRKVCSYRVIVRRGGAIWLNPFAAVLFTVPPL